MATDNETTSTICDHTGGGDANGTCQDVNNTETFNFDTYRYEAFDIYYFSLYVILLLPTVFGNTLILIALARFKKLRSSTAFIMIGNLAVSDFLVGVTLLPLDIIIIANDGLGRNPAVCLFVISIGYCFMLASVINLLLLSLERFHAIVYPLQHVSRITKRRVFAAVAMSWTFVLGFGLSPLFGWRLPDEDRPSNYLCRKDVFLTDSFMDILCSIVVSVMIMNGGLFIAVMRVAVQKLNTYHQSTDHRRLRRNLRHSVIIMIISGLFIILWGPFCIVSLIPNPSQNVLLAKDWLASLGLINSCLNWIVYGIRSKQFRQAMKGILTCACTNSHFDINTSSG